MDGNLTPEQTKQIADELAAGSKIGAIKLYRTFTGKDLKDSKDFIDALIPTLIADNPTRYAKLAKGSSGCGPFVLVCVGIVVALTVWFLSSL